MHGDLAGHLLQSVDGAPSPRFPTLADLADDDRRVRGDAGELDGAHGQSSQDIIPPPGGNRTEREHRIFGAGQPVVHFEITGKDGKRLQEFYTKLFDWHIDADNLLQLFETG
jgi:hypothetical protein